jgi:glycosyltransferase involved in cell wall biosynthesis
MAATLGLTDRVSFVGEVTDVERDSLLNRAHVFAMVSRHAGRSRAEGFGIVYLEAAAHGLPVVAGRAGGAVDAVRHGATAVLVEPEDHVAVASAVTELLLNHELARRMGTVGRRFACRHTWEETSRRVENLILDVINNPGGSGEVRRCA